LKSISEAFDATAKVLTEALGSDFTDVVDAADDFLTSFVEHIDNVIQQSKGKARALGEQIQNLNEEVMFRNERAKKRAKELKKKGGDIVRAAKEEMKERTKRARQRARELKQTVVDNRHDALRDFAKKHKACERVFTRGKKKNEDHEQRACSRVKGARDKNCRHTGMRWAEYRARRFRF
jgi:dsDNA-specific endonuclease/ATPase MutS2